MHFQDFIPAKEEDFNSWQNQFQTYLTPNAVAWGIPLANPDYVDLLAKQSDWVAKFAVGKKAAMPTHPQIVAKQTSRHSYEKAIRQFNKRYIISNGVIADSDKASLGVTIADAVRTRSQVPNISPEVTVNKIAHQLHQLRIADPTNPDTKEMPEGAIGAQVFVSITPVTAGNTFPDPTTFYFVAMATRFDFDVHWATNQGKTAFYFTHYVDIHGATGPGSNIVSAVIA